MAPKMKLIYFDAAGRAEPIRVTFIAGGVEFEDARLKGEEFMAIKDTLPTKVVPVLKIDGEQMVESSAILRYAGMLSNLYPKDPLSAFIVDEFMCLVDNMFDGLSKRVGTVEENIAVREKYMKTSLPTILELVEKRLTAAPGPFLLGEEMTIADIKMSCAYSILKRSVIDGVPPTTLDAAPAIKVNYEAVMSTPSIKAYYEQKNAAN